VQKAVFGRRDIAEYPLIGNVSSVGVSDHIERIQDPIAVDGDAKKALTLTAGFGADEIRQARFGKVQVQFVFARRERNVVPEITATHVPIDVGIQCADYPLGRTNEDVPAGKEPVRPPHSPAAIDEGVSRARDHPQIPAERRRRTLGSRNGG
jgi:hypothetical protein